MDFTLTVGQCRLVQSHRQKIQDLFRVAVQLPDLMQTSAAGVGGSTSAPVWVEISGESDRAKKAKVSIMCKIEYKFIIQTVDLM